MTLVCYSLLVYCQDKVKVLASCIQDLDQQKEVLFSTISKIECNSTLRALAMGRKLTAANLVIKVRDFSLLAHSHVFAGRYSRPVAHCCLLVCSEWQPFSVCRTDHLL